LDETGGSDRSDRKYRSEAWNWMLAGGGVYDHLDFSFTIDHPDGSAVPLPPGTPGGGGPELRRQLRVLKQFMESLDFIRMKPDEAIMESHRLALLQEGGSRTHATLRVLSEPGQAYAVYVEGGGQVRLVLELPAAAYRAEWINTKTGQGEATETFDHPGGKKTLDSPHYSEDIALRVQRQPRAGARSGKSPPPVAEAHQ
jgi:hypothetical protein